VILVGGVLLAAQHGPGPSHAAAGRPSPSASTHALRHAGRPAGSPLSANWRGDGRPVTLVFGGDVHFEGPLGVRLAADPATALGSDVATLLAGANLSMTNFESALTYGSCPDPQPKQYVFHAPPTAITALRKAHVTLVTEANNHGEDCGRAGLEQAMAIARRARYPIIGIGQDAAHAYTPYRTVINGQRIAIIAATQVLDTDLAASWTATAAQPGVASAYQEKELIAAVQQARRTADTVIVYLHWGTETDECPNPIQEPLARALVHAGADIVIGTHAHVQLGAGYLGTALVDYGLGNLAFYDTTPPETYSGTLVVTVTGRHIDSYHWRPALIENGLPIPEYGAVAAAAITRWRGLRACTDLSVTPGTSLATLTSETQLFSGPQLRPIYVAAGICGLPAADDAKATASGRSASRRPA
jgi:hypothetical protein